MVDSGWKKLIGDHAEELPYYSNGKDGFACWLRDHMTQSERILWCELRDGGLDGLEFESQAIVCGFIVDFYCREKKIAIEVDGGIHQQLRERDKRRDGILRENLVRTIHVTSDLILDNVDGACEWLRNVILKFDKNSWYPRKKKASSSFTKIDPLIIWPRD